MSKSGRKHRVEILFTISRVFVVVDAFAISCVSGFKPDDDYVGARLQVFFLELNSIICKWIRSDFSPINFHPQNILTCIVDKSVFCLIHVETNLYLTMESLASSDESVGYLVFDIAYDT